MDTLEYRGDCPDLCRGASTRPHEGRFVSSGHLPGEPGTAPDTEEATAENCELFSFGQK